MTRLPTRPRPVSSQHQGLLVSLWSRGEHSSSTRRWLHLPTRRPLQVRLRTHQSRRKIGHLLPNQVGGVKKRVANHVPRNPVNIRINVLLLNNRKSTGTSSSLYLVPGKALKLWLMDCTFRCPYIDCTNSDSTRGFRLLKNVRVSNVCVDASAAIHPTDSFDDAPDLVIESVSGNPGCNVWAVAGKITLKQPCNRKQRCHRN